MTAYTIEQALGDYQGSDGEPLTYTELQTMLAELHELRRDAWHWREAQRLRMADSTRWFTIVDFVAKGDAEWERKAAEASR